MSAGFLHTPYRAGRLTNRLTNELTAAVASVDRLPADAKGRLYNLVGDPGQRPAVGAVGLQAIQADRRTGSYEPAEIGQKALIFACRDIPANQGGRLIDLVAWNPKTGETFLRIGSADMLGEWWLTTTESEPLTVFDNPAAWAKADGNGVVLLDWHRAYYSVGHLPALAVHNVGFGQRLRAAVRPPPSRRPTIYVENGGRHVAAA